MNIKNAEKFIKALGDDKRLRILKMLEKKNLCVCEITTILGLRQPTVSKHLKKLKDAGLIEEAHNGFFTEYRLAHAGLFDIVWRLLAEKLENADEVIEDARKMNRVNRYEICRRRAA